MVLKRRKSKEKELDALVDEAKEEASEIKKTTPVRFEKRISTGSTLLDLAISGGRVRGGGLPPGVLVEIYGPSGSGKTSVLAEICASSQRRGGRVRFRDPESRLDQEYATIYGVNIAEDFFDYGRPDTVKQLFTDLWEWKPECEDGAVNVFAADSIAALSTDMEMEDEDKRGQRQAKEFSQSLRKAARLIGEGDMLVVFTNQVRQGDMTEVTPGGKALEFYASLRIRVGQKETIKREVKTPAGKKYEKSIGILSNCYVKKSTIDDPYRTAPIYILFNYGIDDVRANLQWLKDMNKATVYECPDGKTYQSLDKAIAYIEANKYQKKLRKRVINLWEEVESLFVQKRSPKVRF